MGASCLKFTMFAFNFVFWAIGATMLGIGIWLAVDDDAHEVLEIASSAGMDDSLWAAAVYITIAVGAFLFLTGFLGCWGALGKGRPGALLAYAVLVSIVLVAEFVVFILLLVYHSSIEASIQQNMKKDIETKYGVDNEDTLTDAWDNMQKDWKCCGSYNYTDYSNSSFYYDTKHLVPDSCCSNVDDDEDYAKCRKEAETGKSSNTTQFNYLHPDGCYVELTDFLSENAAILIGITCAFFALEIIGLVLACCLLRTKKPSEGQV